MALPFEIFNPIVLIEEVLGHLIAPQTPLVTAEVDRINNRVAVVTFRCGNCLYSQFIRVASSDTFDDWQMENISEFYELYGEEYLCQDHFNKNQFIVLETGDFLNQDEIFIEDLRWNLHVFCRCHRIRFREENQFGERFVEDITMECNCDHPEEDEESTDDESHSSF